MTKLLDTFVTVVLITDIRSSRVAARTRKATSLLKIHYANYEVLVVDNGLTGKELQKLKDLLPLVPCIRVIRLAKITELDTAVFAGVEAAIGDYICILYDSDPIKLIPDFIAKNQEKDIVFGVADNLKRQNLFETLGARFFYWYNRNYLKIHIPIGSTYFISINRNVANALTRTERNIRHFRHLAKLVGFSTTSYRYSFAKQDHVYTVSANRQLVTRALDMIAGYSSHPLRVLSYIGIFAGLLNLVYAAYVLIINIAPADVEKGWTTLSLQSSLMFFILFMILAVLCEYIGKILVESRNEPPYHIMQELSSSISLADETRRNVAK